MDRYLLFCYSCWANTEFQQRIKPDSRGRKVSSSQCSSYWTTDDSN